MQQAPSPTAAQTPPAAQAPSSAQHDQYKSYLLDGENIEIVFDLGLRWLKLYRVIATNRRFIIIKKFPKNLIEIDYANIELLEYYTNVDWLYSIYASIIFIVTSIFFINRHAVAEQLAAFLPPLSPIIYAPMLPGVNAGEFLLAITGLCVFGYFFGLFVLSLLGRLRILIYDQPPIDVVSALTSDIQSMIKVFETKKRTMGPSPMQQARPNLGQVR
jgi:hypothetical protein